LKKVAITGGISSGKSTACRIFKEFGAFVVSADEIAHQLLASDPKIQEEIVNLLGSDVLIQGKLDRQTIAEKVFSQLKKLNALEHLLHPRILHEIQRQYQAIKSNPKYSLFVAEVPLLYETQSESLFDFVVVILAKEDLCKKRSTLEECSGKCHKRKKRRKPTSPYSTTRG
jgi:dephospho-CoA kinase